MTISPAELQAHIVSAIEHGLLGRYMDSYNVLKIANLQASWDSSVYYQERMLACEVARDDLHLLEHAVSRRTVDGTVLEFGVASGRTINHLAALLPDETIHGFDWFQGLPETWRAGFGTGAFAQAGVPQVRANVELIHGLFEATLEGFVLSSRRPVSLLHVDCDLYSSTVTIFRALRDYIVPGTVIVFDEYFNYTGWRQHEWKAFQEFVAASGRRYEYLALVPHHQQVSVVIKD